MIEIRDKELLNFSDDKLLEVLVIPCINEPLVNNLEFDQLTLVDITIIQGEKGNIMSFLNSLKNDYKVLMNKSFTLRFL